MIKLISFNVDGSLLDKTPFDRLFWFEEMPLEYSRIHKISLEKSKAIVEKAYKEISLIDPDWHRPAVWFKKLNIQPDEARMVKNLAATSQWHRDAVSVLEQLYQSHSYKLIAVSGSSKGFLAFKFKAAGLQGLFHRVFASCDDAGKVRQDPAVFKEILQGFHVLPQEVVHVGDDPHMDVAVPQALGIHAVLLDRDGRHPDTRAISSLSELKQCICGLR